MLYDKITLSDPNPVAQSQAKKFTGKKAFLWLVGFFLIIFLVNGIMAYIAVGTWGGLQTQDPYRKGLFYNKAISAANDQKKSGWKMFIAYAPKSLSNDRFDIKIIRPMADLPPAKVSLRITRAVTNAYDQEIILTHSRNGIYTGPVTLPLPGQWNIAILTTRPNGAIYRHDQKIFIPAAQ